MIELEEIPPEPVGTFILAQKDVPYIMDNDGAYYHYKDVITLLVRYKELSIAELVKEYNELLEQAEIWKQESGN